MPRKTKETNEEPKKTQATKTATKKTAAKKTSVTVKNTKADTKSTSKKESDKVAKKTSTSKKTSTTKKATTKKATTKTTKKSAAKKTTTRKNSSKTKKQTKKKIEIVEYYDLPYRYNQTVVKILAQTPTTLFIYWDISDTDRKNFEKQYGEDFFQNTKPVLIIYNDTLGYNFEIDINDFANSWYLHVNDAKCAYRIELGRRPIKNQEQFNSDYFYVSQSNEIESPNDKLLLDTNQKMVYFRNVKTGEQSSKNIANISFMRNMGKIYDIYDLYKAIYQKENIEGIYDSSNPSS